MKPTPGKDEMSFDEWLTYGYTRQWVTPPVCLEHDGVPATEDELSSPETCNIHVMRVFTSGDHFDEVAKEYAPMTWRALTRKLFWED